ncbi:hypothetical protein [Mesorhizobium sp. BH1-1-4]|uniref:hypothetical protein n=1 Tax=Mesorhizobium sp. BH1-1-4 TaxID=2876662 RepID=UPI001CD0EDD0|nr:hypothetical protein [Mesorhizobium sp. BH1-1-4]MBZ9996589.1 hypothetical protein [Mesorhizobium sp. BH1-1-4]
MTDEQRQILEQHNVRDPADLPLGARLAWANAPSDEAVRAASRATEAFTNTAANVPADAGRFAIDGAKLWETARDPRTRAEINDRFEHLASERLARNSGRGTMSDDAYYAEFSAMRPHVNEYTRLTIDRLLVAAGRA